FARLALDLQCTSGGALRLRDRSDLQPARQRLYGLALLGGADVLGLCYSLTARAGQPSLIEELDDTLRAVEDGTGGATAGPIGIVGRVVSTSLDAVRGTFEQVRSVLRA